MSYVELADDLRKEEIEDIEIPPALEKDIELPPHAPIEEVIEEVEQKHEIPGEV
jgi:hypothetical protein